MTVLSDENGASLFPLPLVPFELYQYLDNPKEFPAVFTAKMVWRGKTRREFWETALASTLEARPLLRSRIVRRGFRLFWVPNERLQTIEWRGSEAELDAIPIRRIDLKQENGIHFFGFLDKDRLILRVFVNHACCDGVGFVQFLSDWFEAVLRVSHRTPNETRGADEIAVRRNVDFLKERDQFVFSPQRQETPVAFWKSLYWTTYYCVEWLCQRPTAIKGDFVESTRNADFKTKKKRRNDDFAPKFVVRRIEPDEFQRLLRHIKKNKETLNSFFLTALFARLKDFFEKKDKKNKKKRLLRVTLPFNLRRENAYNATPCNVLSFCFLTRKLSDVAKTSDFSRNVAAEITMFRDWNSAAFFATSLKFFAKIPGLLRVTVGSPHVLSSAVFSNLGDCDRLFSVKLPRDSSGKIYLDGLSLDEIDFSGPCRRGSNVFVSAYAYAKELRLSYRYAPHFVRLDRDFLDLSYQDEHVDE